MSEMKLSLKQIHQWLAGSVLVGDGESTIARVHTDSRSLQQGDLFVALKGERFDAHTFLPQAAASGAVAALAEQGLKEAELNGVQVADSRAALGQLAKSWRQQYSLPLIAVTGSNGKTTVTQMLASILRAAWGDDALATQGNFNNDIGVPLTLLRLRSHHQAAVVELGMNHPGEIASLADMAQASVALVNNAQREHQEFMGTVHAVAQENGCAIAALSSDGVAVFPAHDEFSGVWQSLAGQRQCIRFSMQNQPNGAEVYLLQAQWRKDHWDITARKPGGELSAQLHIAGRHNISNALAATAAALGAGVSLAHIAQGLNSFEPVKGRSRAFGIEHSGKTIAGVDDTYNANPDSVRAAIDVLAELPAPRVLVLGDMGEVGDQGREFHQEVGHYAKQQGMDHVLCLGDLTQHTADEAGALAEHFEDIAQLNARVLALLPTVSSVLVKGSRFMKMERVVQTLEAADQTKKETNPCC